MDLAKRMPNRMSQTKLLLYLALIISVQPVNAIAAWFEASGQAVIHHGNKQIARQNATQEAIKQALLFAGASVKSVQRMADGLLQSDRFEVRSAGEVRSIELIDELYSDGYVTVSIRADIFPQETVCKASDYQKHLVTSFFPIANKRQATPGQIYAMGEVVPQKLQSVFHEAAQHTALNQVIPQFYHFQPGIRTSQMTDLARQTNNQYVMTGEIMDVSVEMPESGGLAFWRRDLPTRQFKMALKVYDGQTGAIVWNKQYTTQGPWEFGHFETVDVESAELWQSGYGRAVLQLMSKITEDVDQALACLPAYGKILNVADERVQINIGEIAGVKRGDELTLFKLNQYYDPLGNIQFAYTLHPTTVVIEQVYPESAAARTKDGSPLANIQPNDFVARF